MTIREYEIICPRCDQDFRLLVGHAEGNQAKPESGTTDCSSRQDAELSNENRAFQPAGNPVEWIEDLHRWAENEIVSWSDPAWDKNYAKGRRHAAIEIIKYIPLVTKKPRGC